MMCLLVRCVEEDILFQLMVENGNKSNRFRISWRELK